MDRKEWLKYMLHVAIEREAEFTASVLESTYTYGWSEVMIEVIRTENGYDYREKADGPVIVYLFEPLVDEQQTHLIRLQSYLSHWKGEAVLASVERVEEENDSWKEDYREVQVGDLIIAPSWTPEERLTGQGKIMWIDPGAAFGTGYHGTTQDILMLLQELDLEGKHVLDIGTGSGILSLYCILAGASTPVYAVDINPLSVDEVALNLQHNGLAPSAVEVIIGDPLEKEIEEKLPLSVDLILINIGGEEDISMLPVVKHHLAAHGRLILSGIVEWIRPIVEQAYTEAGFHIVAGKQSDEWVTLLLTPNSDSD